MCYRSAFRLPFHFNSIIMQNFLFVLMASVCLFITGCVQPDEVIPGNTADSSFKEGDDDPPGSGDGKLNGNEDPKPGDVEYFYKEGDDDPPGSGGG